MAVILGQFGVTYGNGTIRTSGKWATKAVFAFGGTLINSVAYFSTATNIVNEYGVVSTDVILTALDAGRNQLAAAGYGFDRAIFAYGSQTSGVTNNTILVSNLGVFGSVTAGVGTGRRLLAAAGYGGDKAIFGYGLTTTQIQNSVFSNLTNLVSNTGVIGNDVTGVGSVRGQLAAAGYGGDKAIFGYGFSIVNSSSTFYNTFNRVTNLGVVAGDAGSIGTIRANLAAAGYGGDKAIFGYGSNNSGYGGGTVYINATNLVSNNGNVASDTTVAGTLRRSLAAAGYGGDKAIFGYGGASLYASMTNLVSNIGIVSNDVLGIGTARIDLAAASYSS